MTEYEKNVYDELIRAIENYKNASSRTEKQETYEQVLAKITEYRNYLLKKGD